MTGNNPASQAVIWDMDGVIADTAPYHFQAWHSVFQDRGVEITEADFRRNFGQRNDTIIRDTLGAATTDSEIEVISQAKETAFRRLASRNLKPLPGAVDLLHHLKEHGFRLALASAAPKENIALITSELGVSECFGAIVNSSDVIKGKPDPQVFRLAAERLGVAPLNCVVIEDAVAGVAAAKRAGMACLAVTNTHPRERLAAADLVVDSLTEVTVADLAQLINQAV